MNAKPSVDFGGSGNGTLLAKTLAASKEARPVGVPPSYTAAKLVDYLAAYDLAPDMVFRV